MVTRIHIIIAHPGGPITKSVVTINRNCVVSGQVADVFGAGLDARRYAIQRIVMEK